VAGVLRARAIDRIDQLLARDLLAVAALQRVDQALSQRVGSAAELGRSFVEKANRPSATDTRRAAPSRLPFFRPARWLIRGLAQYKPEKS